MQEKEVWAPIGYGGIVKGYMISTFGRLKCELNDNVEPYEPTYHSSNGYDYAKFLTQNKDFRILPIDEIVVDTFIESTIYLHRHGRIIIHEDGNLRNNHVGNLKIVEETEDWADAVYPIHCKDGSILNLEPGAYMVSNFGRIYSFKTNSFLSIRMDDEYYKCHMSFVKPDGKYKGAMVKLHRLMALSFNIPGYSKTCNMVNHINGYKQDNWLKNLEWCNNQQNVQHAFATGLEVNPKGQFHPRAKFTDEQRKCLVEIVKTLRDVQPIHIVNLVKYRLPRVTRYDIKGIRGDLRDSGTVMPDLSTCWNHPQKFTSYRWEVLKIEVDKIFDKYGITETQEYMTEYEVIRNQKRMLWKEKIHNGKDTV